ncbi:type I restriction endonuclease subunit R [Leptolyngbya sp. NIES-2104]|uniref:type I restriction endonuclease subunit R n=1 Tax=Leptolyngbya sp. NIES-2104 TaxID=1552121 RepID=UPI0006EC9827|nr:type I restriction endonuclease subunit R [Leptolyngbya sp. NIES-2104]GAQ00110.1 type I restriction-modification system, restriction subunit R [Leptolyngbya sp. NIES-2104]
MPNFISEDDIEQAILRKLNQTYGFQLLNCYTVNADDLNDRSNRTDKRDVIFHDRLKAAALRLNPALPETAIDKALAILTNQRSTLSTIAANREIDGLIRNGIQIEYENAQGRTENGQVRIIDFNDPRPNGNNEFLAVSQLWIKGDRTYRRPDILLYINGLPLVFIELKNSNIKLQSAYDDNLTNYKRDIPQLFHTNAFCILSNAIETKIGSFTAAWEYFFHWLRPEDEKEKLDRDQLKESGTSLERAIDGLCALPKLLDYLENFILFHKETQKIIAQNHQFIGVNRAIESFTDRKAKEGKLGVFWHTQGSGKSFSMIFYARKIFRKLKGNFTFVVITDREDLDRQIYRNFLNTETVKKDEAAQPNNSKEMRQFLSQNKRIVFTLIQKFRYEKGKPYPKLSDRDDIIVIVDEAHRTQYKSLAENMRTGLPNANYLAFTGTPLLGKDRKTNAWFGDYVSEYNFSQSMDDGATVPLFYQKRVPEVLIQNEDLSEEFYQILEEENLDDAQQASLERKFAREVEVIKRDDRLDTIAKDIVYHFPRRGYLGKGMIVSVDKFTAVKMYDKVQHHWKAEIKNLVGRIKRSSNDIEKARLKKILDFMRETDMAVVISQENSEAETDKFAKQGLDIKPHRDRLNSVDKEGHDIEYQFKDADHPLQLVFVCSMWLTGFDVPSLSTLYLDKPMKDHTLMQTIARANRVSSHSINHVTKANGEIIDYYNVFRNMKQALAAYALGGGENLTDDDTDSPIQKKANLFTLLDDAIAQGLAFCQQHNINLESILAIQDTFRNLEQFNQFADTLLQKDEWRKAFAVYENTITSLYEACKPEILSEPRPIVFVFQYLRGVIDSIIGRANIDSVSLKIAELLDESVVADNQGLKQKEYGAEYKIVQAGKVWDLSQMNFDKLKTEFQAALYKNIEIADLRSFLEDKLNQMLQQNTTRTDFAQRLQAIIDRYNAGGSSTENYYEALVDFAENLKQETERHVREGLTEDELELFDLLKKDKMTADETQKVRLAAKSLLSRLIANQPKVLVQDWYKDDQSQRRVKSTVEEVLDDNLPGTYDRLLFKEKCDRVFDLIYSQASKGQKWAV